MNPQWTLHDRFIRITELLSRDSSYVEREAGVYALVSLADDWRTFHEGDFEKARKVQQSCLNMICSQLRDPLPLDGTPPADVELLPFKHRIQRVLAEHFLPTQEGDITWMPQWYHLDLDLSYCHLHNLDFRGCEFNKPVEFSEAHFHGTTFFDKVHFGDSARFVRSHFHSAGSFTEARFQREVRFDHTRFDGGAVFIGTRFLEPAHFSHAHMEVLASFDDAEFHGYADFDFVTFEDCPWFRESIFHATASFNSAEFNGLAKFEWTKFLGRAHFNHTQFNNAVNFEGTEFVGEASFHTTVFWQEVTFDSVLCHEVDFSEAHFHLAAEFPEQLFTGETSFVGTWFCEGFHLHPGQGRGMTLDFTGGHTGVDEAALIAHLAGRVPSTNLDGIYFSHRCDSAY